MKTKILTVLSLIGLCAQAHAENYYQQFTSNNAQVNCRPNDLAVFRYATTGFQQLVGSENGWQTSVKISLQLFKDGRYYAKYEEKIDADVLYRSRTVHLTELAHSREIRGKWGTRGDQIEVGGLGKGMPAFVSGRAGFFFYLDGVLNDPRALKIPFTFVSTESATSPSGQSAPDYCRTANS